MIRPYPKWCQLTHWGRVAHVCVRKLTIIGLDDGLSLRRRQAIIWNNAGILLIVPLGTNLSGVLSEIHIFSLKKAFENSACILSDTCQNYPGYFHEPIEVNVGPVNIQDNLTGLLSPSFLAPELKWAGYTHDITIFPFSVADMIWTITDVVWFSILNWWPRADLIWDHQKSYLPWYNDFFDDPMGWGCFSMFHLRIRMKPTGIYPYIEADSRFAPSQWETMLLCNYVSHRLGAISPVYDIMHHHLIFTLEWYFTDMDINDDNSMRCDFQHLC